MCQTRPVDLIIAKFGGLSALSRGLGHRNVTTVQGWKVRGVIPARRQPEILALARKLNIDLQAGDFFLTDSAAAPVRQRESGKAIPAPKRNEWQRGKVA